MSSDFPYAERFAVNRTFPAHGRDREDIIDELSQMAKEEDAFWETGQVSGTMYCGDHSHYDFLTRAFGLFAHVNVLQRDMCPSATRFEGEIIAMALDLFHADAIDDGDPVGLVNGPVDTSAPINTSATVGNTGGNQPVNNLQPYLAINYIIALQGIFPSRS